MSQFVDGTWCFLPFHDCPDIRVTSRVGCKVLVVVPVIVICLLPARDIHVPDNRSKVWFSPVSFFSLLDDHRRNV